MRKLTPVARKLRRNLTDTEALLWRHLRNGQMRGLKFRRQFPIGPYIVDFACWDARLVVEVDGGQHADNPSDKVRQKDIEESGFRVLRFWNNEVLDNLDGVLSVIANELADGPHPSPGPSGRPLPKER